MYQEIISISLELLQVACVIVVAAYLITRSRYFSELIEGRASWKTLAILAIFFGAFSIYGCLSSINVMGGLINVRDLGPMVGGLLGGPLVGVGAGLIGGTFRMAQGGFTAVPCAIAAVLAGVVGGLIRFRTGRFPEIQWAVAFAVLFEIFHMVLTLALSRPFYMAVEVVKEATIPMIVGNASGMLVFAYIISNFLAERKAMYERDLYQKELEKKRAEMEVAADIQKSFLPERTPSLPGFDLAARTIPAKEVGGDFYDFIEKDGKTGLVIADVAGKSVPAAIFMALSRTILRSSATHYSLPSQLLSDANRMISADSGAGMFVTLFLGILDWRTGSIEYSNAGHLSPMILRASSDWEFDKLKATGIALGIMDGSQYESRSAMLNPGDILVLYTDGVVEAVNAENEQFGLERLMSAISGASRAPAKDIIMAVLDDLAGFTSGQEQFDDITLLIVKAI